MKNIEKYPNTKDALAAYNAIKLKKVPFGIWLECEFEEPRVPTLLEAAQEVKEAWFANMYPRYFPQVSEAFSCLWDAVEREKRKPVRNCDRPECATTKAAQDVWRKEDGGKTAYYEWLLATSTKGGNKCTLPN